MNISAFVKANNVQNNERKCHMSPNALVAKAVQRERLRAELSLSGLAEKAGLAKSTLSQLEAGHGNPSLETLWAIATALDVPFSFLFEFPQPDTTLIRAGEGVQVLSDVSPNSATLLADCPPARRRDLYRMEMRYGSIRASEPHHSGTIEHAFVASGHARLGPEGNLEEVGPGDYYRFPADGPHSYEALSETAVVLIVMDTAG